MTLLLCACAAKKETADSADPAVPSIVEEEPEKEISVPEGTWGTASMGYEADGTVYPEYHARFTDTKILYGHETKAGFEEDHSDSISRLERTEEGGFRIWAQTPEGHRYTYRTSGEDPDVLEYYDTWDEEEFPEMYRGGASLWRVISD